MNFFDMKCNEELKTIDIKVALLVPDNSKILIPVSKHRKTDVDVSFGKKFKFVFLVKLRLLLKLKID